MPQLENDIAGLRSLVDLLNESMATAGARERTLIAAKICDAIDVTERDLATCIQELERRSGPAREV